MTTEAPQYDSMILCPDTEAGYTALHEAIQNGWIPIFHWTEWDHGQPHNHIALRRHAKDSEGKEQP